MEDNAFEKFKSMVDNGNIPEEFKNIISNMNSSNSKNSGISPEAISNLMSMLNSKSNGKTENHTDSRNEDSDYNNSTKNNDSSGTSSIDLETIMKVKSIMDKMNSKDDPRSKLLISLKPYLKESRKNKVDQYIQFFKMSQVIDIFSKSNGDDK